VVRGVICIEVTGCESPDVRLHKEKGKSYTLRVMGNDTSADASAAGTNDVSASSSPAATAVPTVTVDTANNNAAESGTSLNQRPRSNSAARRIIKATHPKADAVSLVVDVSDGSDEKEEDLEDSGHSHRKNQVISHQITESPSVAREIEQEKAEHLKKERMQTAAERQRAKRDKEMQERRNNPHKHPEQEAKANPMSRFLSVFSVEPAHPEHKRAFETSPEDKEDLNEPSGKRLRPSETSGDDADKESNKKFSVSAIAVAVVAVVVGVVLRFRRANPS
jgi:thiol:disulfide interchange protein